MQVATRLNWREAADHGLPPCSAAEHRIRAAERLYRDRRERMPLFKALDLVVAEPLWDILLTAFVANLRDTPLSVTAACLAAAAPTSTALRAVYLLERNKVVRLERDKSDKRRSFVKLSSAAIDVIGAYLDRVDPPSPGESDASGVAAR